MSAVDWSPSEPYLFASVSDDQTIRIWGLEEMEQAEIIIENKSIIKTDVFNTSSNQNRNGFNGIIDSEEE